MTVLTEATTSAPSLKSYRVVQDVGDDIFARQKLSYLNYFSLLQVWICVVELFSVDSRRSGKSWLEITEMMNQMRAGILFSLPESECTASPGKWHQLYNSDIISDEVNIILFVTKTYQNWNMFWWILVLQFCSITIWKPVQGNHDSGKQQQKFYIN